MKIVCPGLRAVNRTNLLASLRTGVLVLSSTRLLMRIIIFSGSGGAGVTTLAASTAAAAAKNGARTLAYGLNPGLARAYDAPLSSRPVEVAANLRAIEGHSSDSPDE